MLALCPARRSTTRTADINRFDIVRGALLFFSTCPFSETKNSHDISIISVIPRNGEGKETLREVSGGRLVYPNVTCTPAQRRALLTALDRAAERAAAPRVSIQSADLTFRCAEQVLDD
jgi:hypothetical protein